MQRGHSTGDRLVSRAEIARLAGVRRPAVTNWQRRHADFPAPIRAGDTEYFSLARILAWLDSRTIPANARAANEPAGATYADRVRHNRGGGAPQAPVVPAAEVSSGDATPGRQLLKELMGPLADSVRGAGSVADYLDLLLSLVLLRVCAPGQWSTLAREAQAMASQDDATRLLRRLGGAADELLRRRGLLPGMQASLLRLGPRTCRDLAVVIDLSGSLGRGAFRLLLDQYDTQVGLTSREFFTPPSLAQLIARLLWPQQSEVRRIYDPYARAGELLAAVAALAADGLPPGAAPPVIRGESPYRDALRLAGMNLALSGLPLQIQAGSAAPWNEAGWPRSKADQRTADLIVTNPPFNHEAAARNRTDHEWPYGPPPPGNDNFAWLQHVLACLEVGGRAAVVMPHQAGVSANRKERRIRRNMVERGAVECVITLPSGLFSGTHIPVSVWILTYPVGSCDQVLFIDASGMGVKTRGQRTLSDQDRTRIEDIYRSWRDNREHGRDHPRGEFSVSVGVGRLRAHDHCLNPPDYLTDEAGTTQTTVGPLGDMLAQQRRLRTLATDLDTETDGLCFVPVPRSGHLLPDGWRRTPLHTLCDIQAGPSYSRLRAGDRSTAGVVPVVLPKHIRNRRITDSDDKVPSEVAEKLGKFRLQAGDILCVRSGTAGASALVEESQNGWLFSTNLLRLRRRNPTEVDPAYLLDYLCLPRIVAWIQHRSRATIIPSISSASLGQLSIALPPLAEQRRIGEALRALDDQITAHRDLVQLTQQIRAGLAEHLMKGLLAVT